MNLKDLAAFGTKFVVEPESTQLSDSEKRLLSRLRPIGILFRKRNFVQGADYSAWLTNHEELCRELKETIGREHLIFCIDHEGGRVIRPPLPITPFPYAARWLEEVSAVAKAMAIELRSIGINVNFAPVADIHSNPDNPVINERAFAATAAAVTQASVKFAATLMENEVTACAKHFPGHGDTKHDSHFDLPVLQSSLDELRKRELVPFQALIDMGIPMVMTAHILFPQIDAKNQATVSSKILNDLLRKEMGFSQVVIADALGMKAVSSEIESLETTARALNATMDLFLVAGDNVNLESALRIAKQMQTALQKGLVSEETLVESCKRIDRLVLGLPQHPVVEIDEQIFADHKKLSDKLAERMSFSSFEMRVPGFE
jgi:beta-N-acetylhexosaminidase